MPWAAKCAMARADMGTEPPVADHRVGGVQGAGNVLLQLQKPIQTVFVQQVLKGPARFPADHQVRVQKVHAQSLGQDHADGALARAGHSDEDDIHVIPPCSR